MYKRYGIALLVLLVYFAVGGLLTMIVWNVLPFVYQLSFWQGVGLFALMKVMWHYFKMDIFFYKEDDDEEDITGIEG